MGRLLVLATPPGQADQLSKAVASFMTTLHSNFVSIVSLRISSGSTAASLKRTGRIGDEMLVGGTYCAFAAE